jgi:hypothetical protein
MVEVGIPLQTEKKPFLHSFFIDLFAGGISGIAAKTASAPLDRIKLLMQTQKINRAIITPYKSSWDCAVRVYAEEGLSSFWRGNLANVYRYFPSQALNFAFKDQFKGIFVQDSFKDDLQYGKAKVNTKRRREIGPQLIITLLSLSGIKDGSCKFVVWRICWRNSSSYMLPF